MATATTTRRSLEHYLNVQYPFNAVADEDGGYVIVYPDLSGCITQVEHVSEIAEMAEDARRLWIETAYAAGADIPEPSYPEHYSGKFNLRIPRSLHRRLAESADREGVSLNQYVTGLLEAADTRTRLSHEVKNEFAEIKGYLRVMQTGVSYQFPN